ncbi:glycosyltransferase family 2 protein [Fodinicurvata sp. EGI_FJ10296]|uniref:glycosyltransferase family 2 protein n=1 Tax=Fodinicurvata sp. EGI_FJ10296 TaxID=3231908 RepID=UPI0034541FB0
MPNESRAPISAPGTKPDTSNGTDPRPTIAVVVPVFDEEDSLGPLVDELLAVAAEHNLALRRIVMVDDGSRDGSWSAIRTLSTTHPVVSGLRMRRNFGKSLALDAGIRTVDTDIIVTMDADLQDDPSELPRFIAEIDAGWDLVSGWKRQRNDPTSKTLPSRLFNRVTAAASGVKLNDFNCGYKAYRREVFHRVQLYGELHRYVPVLAHYNGFTVTEIPVNHRARRFGRSKFGAERFIKGFLDLLTVMAITRFAQRPGHLFGGAGILMMLLGGGTLTYLTLLKLITGADIGGRPLLMFGVMMTIISVQLIVFGMLAEIFNARMRPGTSLDAVKERTGPPASRPPMPESPAPTSPVAGETERHG